MSLNSKCMRILVFSALLNELVVYPPEYHDAEQSILVVVRNLSRSNGMRGIQQHIGYARTLMTGARPC